ncbi:Proton-coupled folate transporter [Halotydeus destructor]|nr:Proton-coupled folate transporter [Halotydeus destructor]
MSELVNFVASLKVEPFALLFMVSMYMKSSIFSQFVQDKTCMVSLGLPMEECFNISTTNYFGQEDDKSYIITTSSNYHFYVSLVTTVPGMIAAIFSGPWSDKFVSGRKWMMIVGALGFFLDSTIGLVNVVFFELPAPFLLLTNIPSVLLGGSGVAYVAIYSYAAVNTLPQYRALRFAILEILVLVASPISKQIAGRLMDTPSWAIENRIRNYFALYVIDMATSLAAIIWVAVMINEKKMATSCEVNEMSASQSESKSERVALLMSHSTEEDEKEASVSKMAGSLFNYGNIKHAIKVIFRSRPGQRRSTLSLVILAHFIISICKSASRSIMYEFCQIAFSWTMASYLNVSSLFTSIEILAIVVTMPILKRLQLQDLTLCIIGTLSVLLGLLVRGAFETTNGFYIASVANLYMPLSTIASRSLLSSVVDKTETGSVFAVTECLDTLGPLISSVIFTQIFNATLTSYVGAAFLAGAALSAISLSIYVKLLSSDF